MREIAIGDIHGCVHTLRQMLELLCPEPKDRIIFLGDYVDRGPFSAEVIEELLSFGMMFPKTVFLKGNHEDMMLRCISGEEEWVDSFVLNGGLQTIESYKHLFGGEGFDAVPEKHVSFLRTLPTFHESELAYYVHAGFCPGLDPGKDTDENRLWIRDPFLRAEHDFGKLVVHGHTPKKEPFRGLYRAGIDTGCVFGNKLTAYIVTEDKFVFVPISELDRTP